MHYMITHMIVVKYSMLSTKYYSGMRSRWTAICEKRSPGPH